ncbi:MAG: hypothetical protein AAF387_20940 [Pseudomonadota bacterium]
MCYLAFILILYLVTNGLFMIFNPAEWYALVPGVAETGEMNAHFITDIGFMFLLAGVGIIWRLLDPVRGRSAAIIGAGFLSLHAFFHLYGTLLIPHHGSGAQSMHLGTDILGIYLPAGAALWVSVSKKIRLPSWFLAMATRLAHREISAFEKQWRYDGGYMHDIADADLEAISRFSLLQEFAEFRGDTPTEAWYIFKLLGCLSEDCGPCAQLVVEMALSEELPPDMLAAVLAGKRELLSPLQRLYYDYACAVITHDITIAELGQRLVEEHGATSTVAAGIALITGKAYPVMKYALGHGQHCAQISLGENLIRVTKSVYENAEATS